jgi:hypothetical protein
MRRRREPFDIDAWVRRHPAEQPFPRLRHEPTRPLRGRERLAALREERRDVLAPMPLRRPSSGVRVITWPRRATANGRLRAIGCGRSAVWNLEAEMRAVDVRAGDGRRITRATLRRRCCLLPRGDGDLV